MLLLISAPSSIPVCQCSTLHSVASSPTVVPSSSPTPPGTNLQLLDDDNDDDMDGQTAGILTDQTSAVTDRPRCYPTRAFRRRPVMLMAMSEHGTCPYRAGSNIVDQNLM